jgi:hypothetical protein
VTERARDAEAGQVLVRAEHAAETDHGVRPQQLQCRARTIEIDGAGPNCVDNALRQATDVDLEAELERLSWGKTGTDAAERHTQDRFVQPDLLAPELLVAEGVVAKHRATCLEQLPVVSADLVVPARGVDRRACFGRSRLAAIVVVVAARNQHDKRYARA